MSRERLTNWKCAEPGCREAVHYAYTSQREYGEMWKRQSEHPWRCSRHSHPEQVLGLDNTTTEYIVTAQPSEGASGLYWTAPDGKRRSGFTFGDGYKAFAGDFPQGTRLIVTARIELPDSAEVRP